MADFLSEESAAVSYAHGVAENPLIGKTIGAMLDEVVAKFETNEALVSVWEHQRLTYTAFGEAVARCARALLAAGIRKADRVGIWSTNCVAWVVVQFATAKVGAILVNINPAYRLSELEYALNQSKTNFLIIGEGFKDVLFAEILEKLNGRLPHLHRIVSLVPVKGLMDWKTFLSRAGNVTPSELTRCEATLDFDDVINIQYTSGTTGFPKGAMLTHHNILNNAFWIGERMRLTSRDRLCIPVPFYHCFGMVLANLACVTHGATMVLPAPHFSPLQTLEAVALERCTALHGVPTMFIAELAHPRFGEFDLSTLRTGIMAGAPCPIEVMKRVMEEMHMAEITIACGMTETSPVCNMTEVDDPIETRVGTVGKVMPHQEQKIIDPTTGCILPRGEPGELCYRGYQVMRGYFGDLEATHRTIDEAGWLHGGDLAVMDARDYVRIVGRIKDMICRGGEKIFPREVEEFLFTHPKIAEAYVIGLPDPYYGEQVVAWVKLKEHETMTSDEVIAFCRGQIMDYKIPGAGEVRHRVSNHGDR
ncbi:AMP-dependent synthetase and ligase [Chthoniobacter flavus Ellin428]|uniref:AMP-dependent synthetase and ligase n=1 Tax=Chthoniobacter flavus Ellin428 TaxID=497964 RepID=B4DCF0_9BACT|nr:AMP-binding protein [Chthoniobacter flavus]EDY15899.1 AMP-dependent synthetase and ligase [Chthoniobacter flavus Ellin428]